MDSKRKYERENPYMIKGQVIIVEQDGKNCEDIQLIKIATRDGYFNEFEYGVVRGDVSSSPSESAEPGASIQLKPSYWTFEENTELFGVPVVACMLPIELINGGNYTITFDNEKYEVKAELLDGLGAVVAGNMSMVDPIVENTGEPFFIGTMLGEGTYMITVDQGIHGITIAMDLSALGGSGGGTGGGGSNVTIEGIGGVISNEMKVTGMSVDSAENTMKLSIATDVTYEILAECYNNDFVVRNTITYNSETFELNLASYKNNRIILAGFNPTVKSTNYLDKTINYYYVVFTPNSNPFGAFKSLTFA